MDQQNQLKTSKEWHEKLYPNWVILDPDGWDRKNYEYSFEQELITLEEFQNRLIRSTTTMK
jgi:hypothetical protein